MVSSSRRSFPVPRFSCSFAITLDGYRPLARGDKSYRYQRRQAGPLPRERADDEFESALPDSPASESGHSEWLASSPSPPPGRPRTAALTSARRCRARAECRWDVARNGAVPRDPTSGEPVLLLSAAPLGLALGRSAAAGRKERCPSKAADADARPGMERRGSDGRTPGRAGRLTFDESKAGEPPTPARVAPDLEALDALLARDFAVASLAPDESPKRLLGLLSLRPYPPASGRASAPNLAPLPSSRPTKGVDRDSRTVARHATSKREGSGSVQIVPAALCRKRGDETRGAIFTSRFQFAFAPFALQRLTDGRTSPAGISSSSWSPETEREEERWNGQASSIRSASNARPPMSTSSSVFLTASRVRREPLGSRFSLALSIRSCLFVGMPVIAGRKFYKATGALSFHLSSGRGFTTAGPPKLRRESGAPKGKLWALRAHRRLGRVRARVWTSGDGEKEKRAGIKGDEELGWNETARSPSRLEERGIVGWSRDKQAGALGARAVTVPRGGGGRSSYFALVALRPASVAPFGSIIGKVSERSRPCAREKTALAGENLISRPIGVEPPLTCNTHS
ncbi:hypothetical protein KM043_002949 [Ampulex compressa]|nr:hypothetical protein KM043_002949 [Ampulex compressa]